jgi:cell division protein FtsB
MLKIVVVALLALLFAALQYHLWFGEGSWPRAQAERSKFEVQMIDNERLQQSNATMEAEVLDLKTGLDAIEERARADLGLVKQGDVYYQIIQAEKPAHLGTTGEPVSPVPTDNSHTSEEKND